MKSLMTLNNHDEGRSQEKIGFGGSMDFRRIFMHCKAFITGTDSFGGVVPGNSNPKCAHGPGGLRISFGVFSSKLTLCIFIWQVNFSQSELFAIFSELSVYGSRFL